MAILISKLGRSKCWVFARTQAIVNDRKEHLGRFCF